MSTGRVPIAQPPGSDTFAFPKRPKSGPNTKNEARITIIGVSDRPGSSLEVFSRIAGENITVDMIVQNVGEEGLADISFTVLKDDLSATLAAVAESVA